MDSKCVNCKVTKCKKNEKESLPKFCPMNEEKIMERAKEEFLKDENKKIFINAAEIESEGYGTWPRVKETIELIRRMGYKKVGLAFCGGFKKEAELFYDLVKDEDFDLVSAMCKTGGCDKCELGVEDDKKLKPGQFEPACNPIGQALILNEAGCEFNLLMGLCVGHDSLFIKYSQAPVSCLIVKDRVTGHNPLIALYLKDGYFKNKL